MCCRSAGDNLTRENIMKQAASLDLTLPMLLPGVNVKTAADDFYPDRTRAAGQVQRQDLGTVRQGVRPLSVIATVNRRHLRGAVFSGPPP